MKGVKKIILSLLSIISLNFVSAYVYAGNYNNFGFGGFFQNTLEYIPMTIAFLIIFWVLTFAINRTRMKNGWAIALILSLFSIYGLTKMNIPIDNLFYKIGFDEELLLTIGPWIVLGLAMLIVWKWGFGKLLMIFGLIFITIGIFKIAAESGAAIIIGVILFLIGLWLSRIKKKTPPPEIKLSGYRSRDGRDGRSGRDGRDGISRGNEPNKPNPTPRTPSLKSKYLLRKKYNMYVDENKRLFKKANKIPALNTTDGWKRHRNIQAMKAIENEANRQGFKL